MTHFVGHEACPDCGGSDPLGRWSDGHAYCFNCGRYEKGTNEEKLKSIKKPTEIFNFPCPPLPHDWITVLPDKPREWLDMYGMTYSETQKHSFKWSDVHQSLIMPVYDDFGTLRFWQSRAFGGMPVSKYLTFGRKEEYDYLIGDRSKDTLVLVEDYISAIKVGRTTLACPLFGSDVSIERKNRLISKFKTIVLWLDYDKRKSAVAWKIQNRPFFEGDVHTIWSVNDPKACTDDEIKKQLQGYI